MNIIWISGRCGCGKTELTNSIVRNFERENKKTLKLSGKDFADLLVKNIKIGNPIENFISCFQEYDLLVLDDLDYTLAGKRATQKEIKKVIQGITANNKTEVILITQKRARKIRKLKFNSNECLYRRLKSPSTEFKRNLIKKWLKQENLFIPKNKIEDLAKGSGNLFQLKGLFGKIRFFEKQLIEK